MDNDSEQIFEMLKVLFEDEVEYVGEDEVMVIVRQSGGWESNHPTISGGEKGAYIDIFKLLVEFAGFAKVILEIIKLGGDLLKEKEKANAKQKQVIDHLVRTSRNRKK